MTFEASADNETALVSRYAICLPMGCGRLTGGPMAHHTPQWHWDRWTRPICLVHAATRACGVGVRPAFGTGARAAQKHCGPEYLGAFYRSPI
jgi:hypothetical protein